MTATFQIEQNSSTPGPGIARQDIVPNVEVTFEATDAASHTTFLWEVLSAARGAAYSNLVSPTGEPHKAVSTFVSRGAYLIRLTVDKDTSTEDVSVLYVGLPLENSNLPVPALFETNQDTSQTPHSGYYGAYEKMDNFLKWIDTTLGSGGGGGVFELSFGELSTVRQGQGAEAQGYGSYCFGSTGIIQGDYSSGFGEAVELEWDNAHALSVGRFGEIDKGRGQAVRALLCGETFESPNEAVTLTTDREFTKYLQTHRNRAYSCTYNVVAKHAGNTSSGNLMAAAWRGEFLVVTDQSKDPQLIGFNKNKYAQTSYGNEADWDMDVTVNIMGNRIKLNVVGDSGSPTLSVRWFAYLDIAEVIARNS